MDKEDFYKFLIEDEAIKELLNGIKMMTESFDENGDDFLIGYVIGSIGNLYENAAEAVFSLEYLKLLVLMKDIGVSGVLLDKIQREKEPEKMDVA